MIKNKYTKMEVYLNLIQAMLDMNIDEEDDIDRPILRRQNAIYVEPRTHDIIQNYIKNTWGFEQVNGRLVMKVNDFMRSYGYLPSKYQFIKSVIENCFCGIIFIDHQLAIQTAVYLFEKIERVPECYYIQHTINYYNQEHRYPSIEELSDYLGNIHRMMNDPDGYYQETKHTTPTPNLNSLSPKECDKDECNCGLCFDEIKKGEPCYILPCNHTFHSDKEKCIDATIVDWLKDNRTCPICKQEVIINE